MVHGGTLQTCSHNGPGSSHRNGLDPANLVADPAPKHAAEQGSEVIDGDDASLQETVCDNRLLGDRVDVAKAHEVNVVFGVVHAAHHALVVAKEEYRECGNAVDGDEKLTLLKHVGNVESREAFHGGGTHHRSFFLSSSPTLSQFYRTQQTQVKVRGWR